MEHTVTIWEKINAVSCHSCSFDSLWRQEIINWYSHHSDSV